MSPLRVLVSGIDTLHLFSTAPVRTVWADRLNESKVNAGQLTRGDLLPSLDIAGHTLTVQRSGARTAPLRLDSDHMAVLVSPNAPQNLPTVTVELRSIYLWQRGMDAAAAEAQRVADELTRRAGQRELQVSRVDLTVDFQGWVPEVADLTRIVTRAAKRDLHLDGTHFTGFSIGRGDVVARLYDKTRELKSSGKEWFFDVWRTSPDFRDGEPVWRLEFQVRRPALRKLWLRSSEDGTQERRPLESWLDLLDLGRGLWRFHAGRWLTMREPRTRETRQVLTPAWSSLAEFGFESGLWAGTNADLHRAERQTAARLTDAALAGYLARSLAEIQFFGRKQVTLEDAVPAMIALAQRRMARKGTTLEHRASERVTEWELQRASMAARAHDEETARRADEENDA
jgi:hypothetical protein